MDAGYDEVYVANMGPHYLAMIEAYGRDVLPQLRRARAEEPRAPRPLRSVTGRSPCRWVPRHEEGA